jgi:REP-associated tyrosine transposase
MSNHFHLIVETPKANLSEFMRQFNISYTGYYNRRHRRIGHLYQGRFKAIVVDKDSYLLELSRYVHLNPIRIKAKAQRPETERIREISIAGAASPAILTEKGRPRGSRTREYSAM